MSSEDKEEEKKKIIKKRHKEWQKKMQILDHNLKAYKALIKSFKKANRACIGLGKSYIVYQLIADNPDSAFLVLTSQLFSHSRWSRCSSVTSLKKIEEKWREKLREEGVGNPLLNL